MILDLSELSVLVIDDNSHMRSLFRAILSGFGVRRVLEAGDGSDGLTMMLDRKPDLVICDWVMSPLNGAEFLSILRSDTDPLIATTPVIMVSADARKPVILRALDLGIHEFLAKPVSPAMLYQRMQRVLTEHRPFLRKDEGLRPAPRAPQSAAMPPTAVSARSAASRGQDAATVFL